MDPTAEGFAALMGRLDHPMVVVTTAMGEARSGCLVGFHSQCSIDPPRYAVWISRANHTWTVAALAEHFAVHLLHPDDHDLAELFGSATGDEIDKFDRCEWRPGPGGVPLLARCPDRLVGRRTAMVDAGTDHVAVVLEPLEVSVGDDDRWLGLPRRRRRGRGPRRRGAGRTLIGRRVRSRAGAPRRPARRGSGRCGHLRPRAAVRR